MSHFFVADEMLGDVAKWLRIMGHEVRYKRGRSDPSLIEVAEAGGILLTSDRELHAQATRKGLSSILVTGDSIVDKLAVVMIQADLKPQLENTRCTVCGGQLKVTGEDRLGRVTWSCESCGKIYWKGSHWKNITNTVRLVEQRIARHSALH